MSNASNEPRERLALRDGFSVSLDESVLAIGKINKETLNVESYFKRWNWGKKRFENILLYLYAAGGETKNCESDDLNKNMHKIFTARNNYYFYFFFSLSLSKRLFIKPTQPTKPFVVALVLQLAFVTFFFFITSLSLSFFESASFRVKMWHW